MTVELATPWPWFGGKRKVATAIWARLGAVGNYVEPFFGSGAVLMRRPEPFDGNETVNDLDGYVANFWRAIRHAPEATAEWADNPVNENDLHARHVWLVQQGDALGPRLEADSEWHDPKIAGWWAWGMSCWIGSGFCSDGGPWVVEGGELVDSRQPPHLGNNGRGVKRQLPHLGNNGQGVNRKRPHLGANGQGRLVPWFRVLAARLSRVRVCCGDWERVCGPSVTFKHGLTAVVLDPPYADTADRAEVYRKDCDQVAHRVREWALANGDNPLLRIALCGYEGEHEMPDTWSKLAWNAGEGYGARGSERTGNGRRERVWFSPHCLSDTQGDLFAVARAEGAE